MIKILKALILLLLLAGFFGISDARAEIAVVDGEVLVRFVDGTSETARLAFESEQGLVRVRHLASIDVYHYTFQGVDIWTKLSKIRASGLVFFAEPNYLRNRLSAPNDRFYEFQWYLPNIRWDQARSEMTGGSLVTVAVIDSGVSKAHSHLLGYLLQQGEWDFAGGDADANDESGHGTMVAGIITGNTDEGEGVAGICPTARILPIRVFDNAGFLAEGSAVDASVLIQALDQARLAGAKIANMSLGGGAYSYFEWLALKKCQDAGMLVVCAAGNGGRDGLGDNNDSSPIYPASYNLDCIISVAATDESDRLSIFSNHGASSVDVAAPGEFIVGCDVPRSTLYEWNFNTGWEGWQSYAVSGYGWVWDNFTGEWGLSTRESLFSYFAGYYAANSSMFLTSPVLDLRGKVGSRVEFDVSGSLGFDDYISLSFLDSSENSNFLGIIAYPGWSYGPLNRDISAFDGTTGQIKLFFKADHYGWGTYSSGIFTFQNIRVTVLDQSSWAVDSVWYAQGTSFSAPIVSGIAAALFSQAPSLTAAQVKNLILTTARPVSELNGKLLYPAVVDYAAALRAAKALEPNPMPTEPLDYLNEILGTWGGVHSIYYNGQKIVAALTITNEKYQSNGFVQKTNVWIPNQPNTESVQYFSDNGQVSGSASRLGSIVATYNGTWSLSGREITQNLTANISGLNHSQVIRSIFVDSGTLNVFSTTSYGAKILGTTLKVPEDLTRVSADFISNFSTSTTNGQVALKLTRGGAFSGIIITAAERSAFRGKLDLNGNATITLGLLAGTLELSLKTRGLADGAWDSSDEVYIESTISLGGAQDAIELRPAPRSGGLAAPLAGTVINTLLESKSVSGIAFGNGFAGINPGKDGVFRFSGALADGAKLTGVARVIEDGEGGWKLPVALPLAAVKGFLHGEAAVVSSPGAGEFHLESSAPWIWIRPPNAKAKTFAAGFKEELDVKGRVWSWTKGTSVLGGSSANFTLTLSAPSGFEIATGAESLSGSLSASNKPNWSSAPPKGFIMKITPASGMVSGKVPGTLNGKEAILSYQGLIFPSDMELNSGTAVRGAGFISGTGGSGTMKMIIP